MIDLKTLDKQQLNLLIHNCNVYGVKNEIKQKYIASAPWKNPKKRQLGCLKGRLDSAEGRAGPNGAGRT